MKWAFRFINHIMDYGIENAISLSGGIEYVLNTSIGKSKPLFISFSIDSTDEVWTRSILSTKGTNLLFAGFDYEFEITPHKRGSGFTISQDHIRLKYFAVQDEAESEDIKVKKDRYYILDCKRSGNRIVSSHEDTTQITDGERKRVSGRLISETQQIVLQKRKEPVPKYSTRKW